MPHPNPTHPILIANDVGSKEFELIIQRCGGDVQLTNSLELADFAFMGKGHGDKDIAVGIERKTIRDLADSISTGRLGHHQVAGMVQVFEERYLVVEGNWTVDDNGGLYWLGWDKAANRMRMIPAKFGKRQVTFNEIMGFLITLQRQAGFHLIQTAGKKETARTVVRLWRHYDTPLDEHTSLGLGGIGGGMVDRNGGLLSTTKPGLVWRWATCLDGVGPKIAKALGDTFDVDGWLGMCRRKDPGEWAQVVVPSNKKGEKGKRLGDALGERIVGQLRKGR